MQVRFGGESRETDHCGTAPGSYPTLALGEFTMSRSGSVLALALAAILGLAVRGADEKPIDYTDIDKHVQALTALADHHYIIEKGRVVWTGSSAALQAQPEVQHRYLGVGREG